MSEWISVEDAMPKIGEKVLTLDKFGHIHDRELYTFPDGCTLFRPDGLKPGIHITHWMPMPNLPKEDKQ